MRTIARMALAAAMLAGSAGAAHAGMVSETVSFGPMPTDWTTSLNFAGFNTSLGTLTSVSIDVTETLTGTAQATNSGSSTASGTITLTNTATLNVPGVPVITVTSATTPSFTLTPGQTSPIFPLSASSSNSAAITTGLAAFAAPWSASANDAGSTSWHFTSGNALVGTTDTGAVSVVVDYFFKPGGKTTVMEPLGAAVLASGLLALGLVRRRTRQ